MGAWNSFGCKYKWKWKQYAEEENIENLFLPQLPYFYQGRKECTLQKSTLIWFGFGTHLFTNYIF